ncbi:MAG: hypothetical protein ACTSQJ_00885 [Promethearchaeota archaeon]
MAEENKKSEKEHPSPTIIETEEQKIPERKPPNERIISYNIVEKKEEKSEKNKKPK